MKVYNVKGNEYVSNIVAKDKRTVFEDSPQIYKTSTFSEPISNKIDTHTNSPLL